jgi:hypothetical protein
MTVCKMVRELWWTIHEFFYVDVNPPWFYMHIHITWGMNNMPLWPRFRDVVSPHWNNNFLEAYVTTLSQQLDYIASIIRWQVNDE